jgi:UDP-GlcNAc:undecaprenyl-phosphate GlcNAc-1-phosphate transferase
VDAWVQLPSILRYALSFGVPLVLTLVLTPRAARLAHRTGVLDRPGGHKTHKSITPYMGGLAVAGGLLLIAAVSSGATNQLLVVVLGALLLGAVGLLDDIGGLNPALRLAYQAAAGVALWLVGIRAGLNDGSEITELVLTVMWVVAVVNAFNLIDNMDGVAAGVAVASTIGIAAISAANGDVLVASLALSVAGACLGFLRYNAPPASIFLGDAGSMLLGFLVAALILKLDLPVQANAPRMLAVVLLAAAPLFDLTLVMVDRWRGGRRLWVGGTDHLSHRLVASGATPRGVFAAFVAAQAVCSFLAYGAYRLPEVAAWIGLLLLGILWLLGLAACLRLRTLATAAR